MTATFMRGLGAVCALGSLAFTAPQAVAQNDPCRGLLFSTEEDFTMQRGEGPDGNPIVSDGDLLALDPASGQTSICRRNRDLVQPFDVSREDLGLDAVAAVDENAKLIAFSTELDSPHGNFSAGDLLFTNGAVIPNAVLMQNFDIRHDIGLDAVNLVGDPERWRAVADRVRGLGRDELLSQPQRFLDLLKEAELDLLFSTEGTAPEVDKPVFIDGDLLSVFGVIHRSNTALMPMLPAGVPANGVDFGLDAYTFGRNIEGDGVLELFSSEIVGRAEDPFTDGDVLVSGPSVWLKNESLLKSLFPATFDLGLDALHLPIPGDIVSCAAPTITRISNVDVSDIDSQGYATSGGLNTRPFGGWIRIQAALPIPQECPNLGDYEFRVELDDGSGFPALGDPNTLPLPPNWERQLDNDPNILVTDCTPPETIYTPDANGWFNLADYRRFDECSEDASAAVWNSTALAGNLEAGDPLVTVRFRVVMRQVGASTSLPIAAPQPVKLDNDGFEVPDGDMAISLAIGDRV